MLTLPPELPGLCVAFGIGLLIGVEREHSKGDGPGGAAAGVRTFLLVAMAGAIAQLVGGIGIAIGGGFVALAALASYHHSRETDPGLTTEVAMLVTFLLGVLAMTSLPLAAGLGVAVALVLAGKSRLHDFVRNTLTGQELHDALLLSAAAAIVLPLLPDRAIDPWGALNPYKLWLLVVLVMAINSASYVALRMLGASAGLMLAGFIGGFVSSTATIASMGERARTSPQWVAQCAAAASCSNISTVIMLAVVVGAVSPALLSALVWPLVLSGAAALVSAALDGLRGAGGMVEDQSLTEGRPFEPSHALIFVAIVSVILLLSAGIYRWLGDTGMVAAAAVSGLANAHATSVSIAQLVATGQVDVKPAAWAVFVALATNSASKLILAGARGGRGFLLRVLPSVLAIVAAFAAGVWWLV